MNNYDVIALGELLIDFTENGTSAQGNPVMEANPGGAPCNVLAMLTKLGHKTAFIGKVGDDMFGTQLEEALKEVGISTDYLMKDKEVHTTLAFVHTFPDGDRDFSFYRKPGADMMLSADEVPTDAIEASRIFHFGTLSMTDEVCEKATKKAVDVAENSGKIITFDPNIREPLWKSLDEARVAVEYGISKCDVLKISDNEISWLMDTEDYDEGVKKIFEANPKVKLILVSLGRDGSRAYTREKSATKAPFLQENTIETTGAGDTFTACILHYILDNGLKDYTEAELVDMLTFANAAASLITTRKGALRVMPDIKEIEDCINR